MATAAPYFAPLADGPAEARAAWLIAKDGARIRAVHWPLVGAKGTVILMPGRTEYIEKYGRAAADLARRGYACICVDWRGQGLAVRSVADPMTGHVGAFDEFQRDVDALLAWARTEGAVEPLFLIGHSMGGCIGLRALTRELPFQAAAFSAPMWGISMAAWMRPLAPLIAQLSIWAGRAHAYAPTTGGKTYLLSVPFQGNVLTSDAAMWEYKRGLAACRLTGMRGAGGDAVTHFALRHSAWHCGKGGGPGPDPFTNGALAKGTAGPLPDGGT
jgi:lysophospholipase